VPLAPAWCYWQPPGSQLASGAINYLAITCDSAIGSCLAVNWQVGQLIT